MRIAQSFPDGKFGVDSGEVICWFNVGGLLTPDRVRAVMELFAEQVMPALADPTRGEPTPGDPPPPDSGPGTTRTDLVPAGAR